MGGRRISLGSETADGRLRKIATAQRGRVSRRQLRAAGLSRHAVDRRIGNGQLIPVHPGVFAVAHEAEIPLADETAALLACGPLAWLSHHSVATLYRMRIGTARPIHVITPDGRHGSTPEGVIVHRSRILLPRDVTVRDGLPVTTPARALLDIAATDVTDRELEHALHEALAQGHTTLDRVADVLHRAGGHPGRATLTRVAGARDSTLTESAAEERLHALIAAAGLPAPRTQAPVLGYRPDFLWPDLRVIVEVDGAAVHATPQRVERDRRRDAKLQAAGYVVLRFSAGRIEREPFAVIAEIAAVLAARAAAA